MNEKHSGYCNQCNPGIIGACDTCTKLIGKPPSNLWYKSTENRMNRIDELVRELQYQAENPPKPNLSITDREIWEDYAKRCRNIEEELKELGIEL